MCPKIFILLCSIVALLLLYSSSSLSEDISSDSLSEEVEISHIQPWKRFPCIVGTRYRVRRCRKSGRGLLQKQNQQMVQYAFQISSLKIYTHLFLIADFHTQYVARLFTNSVGRLKSITTYLH